MKKFFIAVFYVMSPFFPGNNWLEISLIGSLAGHIAPFIGYLGSDIGRLRVGIYFLYNLIAIIGLAVLAREHIKFSIKIVVEILAFLILLFLTGLLAEPFGTIGLTIAGLYFLYPHLKLLIQGKLNKNQGNKAIEE